MNIEKTKPKIDSKKKTLFTKENFNISHLICNHIIGKQHTIHHRIAAGIVIMLVGVSVSRVGSGFGIVIVQYLCDGLGYLLHSFGTMPFIEYFTEKIKREETMYEEVEEMNLDEEEINKKPEL